MTDFKNVVFSKNINFIDKPVVKVITGMRRSRETIYNYLKALESAYILSIVQRKEKLF